MTQFLQSKKIPSAENPQYPTSINTKLNAPTDQQNIIDIEKYGDKYYIAVMHPRTGSACQVCIYSSSTGDLINTSNWSDTAVYSTSLSSRYGHDIKIVSGSSELLVYFSHYDNRGSSNLQLGGVGCITSSNGTDWYLDLLLQDLSASTSTLSYSGTPEGFGNSIDLIKDEDNNKLFLAVGAYKDKPFTDIEYSSYGQIGSGSVYILSASLDTPLNFSLVTKLENNILSGVSDGPTPLKTVSGLYGTSVSLNKINNQYQVYCSLPVGYNVFDTLVRPRYVESLWYHYSNNGADWTPNPSLLNIASIADETNFTKDTYVGFAGIKAINYKEKTYLFFSEPGSYNYVGAGFVLFSEENGVWQQDFFNQSNKIKLLQGLENYEQFSSYSNLVSGELYRTFSVDAVSTENGIYYSFGSARSKELRGALHFGRSEDGQTFQIDGQIEAEFGTNTSPLLGTSVALTLTSSAEGEIAACTYSDLYDVNSKIIGNSVIFKIDIESEKAQKSYKHAAIEPFFGPGIFYNTIKSGISVDWPSTSGSVKYEPVLLSEKDSHQTLINQYQPESFVMSYFSGSNGIYNARGSLKSTINYRIPFENLMNPDEVFIAKDSLDKNLIETYTTNNIISNLEVTKFIDKTYIYGGYETYLNPFDINEFYYYGGRKFAVPFVFKDSKNSKKNSLFSKAMNNCLAEIPNFFLEQEKVSIIQSEPDYNWLPLKAGSTYYMDVVLEKSKDLVMMEGWHSDKNPTGSNGERMDGRYYGYPVNKTNKKIFGNEPFTEQEASLIHNDPAYGPYTPPYFEGTAIARLSFTPRDTRKYNLQEVFAEIKIEDIFSEASLGWVSGSDAERHKMKIGSSIELFDSILSTTTEVASSGQFTDANMTTVKEEKDSKVWIIRPRLETPVLNFANQQTTSYSKNYLKSGGFGKGMWSGYGQVPNEGEGIKLKLLYPFDSERQNQYSYGRQENDKYPLFDYIKFKNKEVDIGKIASQKQISEAIILIPYVDIESVASRYGTKNQYIDGLHFIKINKEIYNKQLMNIRAGKNAVTIQDGAEQEIIETSISRMIKTAENYVLPPNLNFFRYEDIEPFVMYFFEFNHTLTQQDLSHIWQGVMPDISYNAELDEVSIQHDFTKYDLFNGSELPPYMKWLVFKVKRKAMTSYNDMINKSKNDQRFNIELENGKNGYEYSYNWPYDFFSLVELAKVEIELEYTKGKTPSPIVGYTILE